MARASGDDPLRKVTINLSPETYNTLEAIAKDRGVSMSEAIRQAIGILNFFGERQKAGDRILVERQLEGARSTETGEPSEPMPKTELTQLRIL